MEAGRVPVAEELERLRRAAVLLDALSADHPIDDTSVEKLLKDKVRHLEAEYTRTKVALSDREQELEQLKKHATELENASAEQTKLIRRLEEDLSRGSASSSSLSSVAAPAFIPASPSEQAVDNLLSRSGTKEEGSMLQIVCSQRDRFRTRIQELETELSKVHVQLERAKAETMAMRSDNVKLFEKIKYLQSYAELSKQRSPSDIEATGELENRYGSLYEESVNPFNVFNKKEKDIQYSKLSPADKVTLLGSRFFLANKYTRTFLFFYSILLHLLVMFSLYRMSSSSANLCLQPSTAAFAQVVAATTTAPLTIQQ